MTVFRIAQKQYIDDLSGTGAYLYGGRWNLKGTRVPYTASSMSLAYLEFLVHQFERDSWPQNMWVSEIEIKAPDSIIELVQEELPPTWKDIKYHGETQQITQKYFSQDIIGIKVPSVIAPREFNVLLNPSYKKFQSDVNIQFKEPLELDKRFGIH
tara:strand:+ start:18224 stop:18688 length:465 start_codon:yes stop_codon:yes gene_type:complete